MQEWAERKSFRVARVVFWAAAIPVVIYGALTLWGLPAPSLPYWLFFGLSPSQQLFAYPLTLLAAVTAGVLVSAPFWAVALIDLVVIRRRPHPQLATKTVASTEGQSHS